MIIAEKDISQLNNMKIHSLNGNITTTRLLLNIWSEHLKHQFESTDKIGECDLIMIWRDDDLSRPLVKKLVGTTQPILLANVGADPIGFGFEFNRLNSIFGKELQRVYCCFGEVRELADALEHFLNFHTNFRATDAPLVITYPRNDD